MAPNLSQTTQQFKRKNNKKPRGKVIAAHKNSLRKKKVACSKLPPKSGAKLYCELTNGKLPVVTRRGALFRLERQGVGLVPLPEVGAQICEQCSTPTSVARSAFECSNHSQPRQEATKALDRACLELNVGHNHKWWSLSDEQKLRASFCPRRGVVPPQKEEAFFHEQPQPVRVSLRRQAKQLAQPRTPKTGRAYEGPAQSP